MSSLRKLTPGSVLRSPIVILFLLACVFLADLFLAGKTFLLRDGFFFLVKSEQYGLRALADGSFPFWDSQGMGRPYLETQIFSFFYPPSVVFGFFSAGVAMNLFFLINIWLLGLGVYFFARQMQLGKVPSLAAAASIMFSTFTMAYLEFMSALAAMPWIFFILGVLARFYHASTAEGMNATNAGVLSALWRQRRLLAALALLFALAFSTFYLEFLVYPFIAYALFIVVAAIGRRSWRLGLSMSLFVGAAGILSLLIVLPQLGLLVAYLPFSERGVAGFDARFDMASLSVVHLLKAVFPMIGGRPGFPDVYWTPGTYEFCIGTFYTGALALLALPFAFLKPWKERSGTERLLVAWAALLALFGLLVSFGQNTPVYPLLWKYVPMMNKLRFASKFLLLMITGEALLIALGIQYVLKTARPLAKRAVAALWVEGALVVAMGALWLSIKSNTSLMPALFGYAGNPIPDASRAAVLPSLAWSYVFLALAFGWIAWTLRRGANRATGPVAIGLILVNMMVVSRPVQTTGPVTVYDRVPEMARRAADNRFRALSVYEGVHQYLYGDHRPDIFEWAMEAGVNAAWYPFPNVDALTQNGIKLQKYRVWMSGVYSKEQLTQNNFLDAAGVRWVVTGEPWPQILWGGASRALRVIERPTAMPRFELYAGWQPVSNDDEALRYVGSVSNNQLRQSPAIEETSLFGRRETSRPLPPPPPLPSLLSPAGTPQRGALTVTHESNRRIDLKVTGGSPQLLVVSDAWYPGWRATIDGRETPMHRANYMFRGVFVPAGEHAVRLDYWPLNFGWYCAISALGLLAVAALFIRRRKHQQHHPEHSITNPA